MSKRIISKDKLFLVKDLFYVFKTKKGRNWSICIDSVNYEISGFGIENVDIGDRTCTFNRVTHLRLWPKHIKKITKYNPEQDWSQTIRVWTLEGKEGAPYSVILYKNRPPDVVVTKYCLIKLYKFFKKNKVKDIRYDTLLK